jgi:hypothetical protein
MTTKKSSTKSKKVTLEQVMMATDKARPKQAIDLKPKAIKWDETALANISAGTEQHIQGSISAQAGVELIASGFDKALYLDHDFVWTEMVMKPNQKQYAGDLIAEKCFELYTNWREAYTSAVMAKGKTEDQAKSAATTQWGRIKAESAIAPMPKETSEKDLVKSMVKAVRAMVKADGVIREEAPKLFTGEDHKTMIAVASAWLVKYDV